jgi:hypothetical protein
MSSPSSVVVDNGASIRSPYELNVATDAEDGSASRWTNIRELIHANGRRTCKPHQRHFYVV